MDKYKVKVSPRAIRELDHIYEYNANEKLDFENAKGQVDRIKRADMPERDTDSYWLTTTSRFFVLMNLIKLFMW